jgi:hypothetical protein
MSSLFHVNYIFFKTYVYKPCKIDNYLSFEVNSFLTLHVGFKLLQLEAKT